MGSIKEEYQILDSIVSWAYNAPNRAVGIRRISDNAKTEQDKSQDHHYQFLVDDGVLILDDRGFYKITPKGVMRFYNGFASEYDEKERIRKRDESLIATQKDSAMVMSWLTGIIALCTVLSLWQGCNKKSSHCESISLDQSHNRFP